MQARANSVLKILLLLLYTAYICNLNYNIHFEEPAGAINCKIFNEIATFKWVFQFAFEFARLQLAR